MKRCPKCNIEYTNDYIFCTKCGSALVEIEKPESEVIDVEVVEEVKTEEKADDALAKQYEQEIEVYKQRRQTLLIWGIVVTALFFTALLVFGILYGYQFAVELIAFQESGGTEFTESELLKAYRLLLGASSFLLEGGIALIVLGIVPNTIKIKNREKYLRKSGK